MPTPGARRSPRSIPRRVETEFFRMLNRLAEPHIRAGCAAPRLVPGGLVVLEITGRRTGRRARVPLAATRIQGHVVVSTFRGRRSQWVRNLIANPEVRLWQDGRPRTGRAIVLAPDHRPRSASGLPVVLRWVLSFLVPYTYAGWAFAVVAPRDELPARPRRAGGRHVPRTRPGRPRSAAAAERMRRTPGVGVGAARRRAR